MKGNTQSYPFAATGLFIQPGNLHRAMLLGMIAGLALLTASCSFEDESTGPRRPQDEYTADEPGEWAGIAQEHLPQISFIERDGKEFVRVRLAFHDPNPAHYIEKIGIFEKATKRDLEVISFDRDTGTYDVELPYHYKDKDVKIFVKCNLHDLWTVDNIQKFR